jgi:predicted O-methyltransferase YrrM
MELTLSSARRFLGRWYRRFFGQRKPWPRFIKIQDQGSLWWHRGLIEHIAYIFKPKVYVELGIYQCELFNRVVPHAQRLIGVDLDRKAQSFMTKSPKVEFRCSTTADFTRWLRANPLPIDMLFIDADHARDAVLEDFWGLFPFVAPHGLILLHDTHPENEEQMQRHLCDDAYKAVDELAKASDQLELMTLPLHPGLTLCRKRKTQLSWMEDRESGHATSDTRK